MEVWYKACCGSIKAVDVEKVTAKYVYIGKRREAKDCVWCWYRPSFKEAKECLIRSKQKEVDNYQEHLNYAKKQLFEAQKIVLSE